MLVLTLTAAISKLHPPECGNQEPASCVGPTPGQMTFLLSGFVLLVIGASGIRPCNLAFGADQFDPNIESGRRGISSFFNWDLCQACAKGKPFNKCGTGLNYVPSNSLSSMLAYTDQFRFLNKAAVKTSEDQINSSDGSAVNPWRLCSIQQVEEVKCLLKIIPIWVAGTIYYVSVVQSQNYVIF
ncbi:hypothetical protein FXO38_06711 [Capsicum annuum]|nr:hypothetical protein FXO37_15796 [Capsicum annuum]KAF3671199.1 hypothetical protein FXO38_06711 [Capsicum annuum]